MSPRSYLGKVAIVTSSVVLTGAYVYYRSGGGGFSSSSANVSVNATQGRSLARDGLGSETGQAQLQRIFVGSTKSTRVFTPRDVPSGN